MPLYNKRIKPYIKVNSSIFKKLILFFAIAVSIPSAAISMLSIKHSSDNIIKQASMTNERILMEKEFSFNHKISEIDNYISLLLANKDIWNLVMLDKLTDSYKDLSLLLEILDLFKRRIDINDQIVSIYLYDSSHDFVLANTKYTKEDFFDRDVLNLEFEGNKYIGVREIKDHRTVKKVVSYIRKFRVFTSDNYVYFVTNLDYNRFFNIFEPDSYKPHVSTLIIDGSFSVAYLNGSILETINNEDLADIWNGPDSFEKEINGTNYFICKRFLTDLNWIIAFMQPYGDLVHTTSLMRDLIIYSSLVIIVLSLVMACLFSVFLYKPLAEIMAEIMIDAKNISDSEIEGKQGKFKVNEYKIIRSMMKKLFVENHELHSKYEMALPYFRYHFANDLLTSSNFDTEKFKSILENIGIYFNFPKFVSVIIDVENRQFDSEIANRLEAGFEDYKDSLVHIISKIDNSRVLVLINTRMDQEMVNKIILDIKNSFQQSGIDLTIAIGQPYEEIEKICESYYETLQLIDNKFFIGKNEIIIYNGLKQERKMLFYDKRLEEEMINHIKSQNAEKAINSLKKLTTDILTNTGSMEYLKYVCFHIINNVESSLENLGVDFSSDKEMSNIYICETINKTDTYSDLEQFFKMFIEKSIKKLSSLKERQHTVMVNKIIYFIENNYRKDLSLEDISEKVYLSPSYVNGIFKAETGMTIFDFITKLRMEEAKNLLMKQNIKIQDIAVNVGYNNIQSFLRTFKKYFKLTPIEYRRKYTCIEDA